MPHIVKRKKVRNAARAGVDSYYFQSFSVEWFNLGYFCKANEQLFIKTAFEQLKITNKKAKPIDIMPFSFGYY
jgi:hypothetical protein